MERGGGPRGRRDAGRPVRARRGPLPGPSGAHLRGVDARVRRTRRPRQPPRAASRLARGGPGDAGSGGAAAVGGPRRRAARRHQVRCRLPAAGRHLSGRTALLHAHRRRAGVCADHRRRRRRHPVDRRSPDPSRHRRDRRGARGGAGPGGHRRRPAHAPAPRRRGVRHLHLRFHRPPQGRAGHPPQRADPVREHHRRLRVRRTRRVDDVPFLRLRLLGLGAVGPAAARRSAGRGRLLHRALAGDVPRPVAHRAGHGAQPDADRVLPTRGGRPPRERTGHDGNRSGVAVCRVRWRGPRPRPARPLVHAASGQRAAAGEHVRHHRDHRARHPSRTRPRVRRGRRRQRHRPRDPRPAGGRPRRTPALGPAGRRRRDVRRGRAVDPRLPGPERPDVEPVRRRPVRCAGIPDVPHRRPRPLEPRRAARIPGPQRLPGEDPRLPDRARRDRGRAVAVPRRRTGRGGRAPGRHRTSAAGRLRGARTGTRRRPAGRARSRGPGTDVVHGSCDPDAARRASSHRERQAGPQGAAATGVRHRGRPRPRSRDRRRAHPRRPVRGGAGSGFGRCGRFVLRAGWRFDHVDPAGVAGEGRGVAFHAA